jgi:tyrosinase
MEKFELGHSYRVLIFLGDVPDDPEHWRTSSSFVGTHAVFVNTKHPNYSTLKDVTESFVYLNVEITEKSGLSALFKR